MERRPKISENWEKEKRGSIKVDTDDRRKIMGTRNFEQKKEGGEKSS